MKYEPGQDYTIEDNVEATRLIVDQNVLTLLKPRPGQEFVAHCFETETHYCLASYHCGHEDEKENGYVVCMASKELHTAEEAAEHFAYAINSTTEGITFDWLSAGNRENN